MPIPLADAVDELLVLLEASDRSGALELSRALRAAGASTTDLIADLLAPAQRRVGDRWATGAWDVAQEHLATGIVDALLAEIELGTDPRQLRGDVVVACVEGEWHSLPARMLAEQLRHRGWAATFLGPSMPADDLGRFVLGARPVAVAISCSISSHLRGALRSIEAVHAAGGRVLAGGAGFGHDGRRAAAVGADAWAPTAAAADAELARWAAGEVTTGDERGSGGHAELALAARHRDVVDAALASLEHRGATAEDRARLDVLLRFAGAALLTGDPTVLDDHVRWLRAVVGARGGASDLVDTDLTALAAAVPSELADARRLLLAARGR